MIERRDTNHLIIKWYLITWSRSDIDCASFWYSLGFDVTSGSASLTYVKIVKQLKSECATFKILICVVKETSEFITRFSQFSSKIC